MKPGNGNMIPLPRLITGGRTCCLRLVIDYCNYIPIGSMYAIYGNMDPINIPPMLAYIPYMDPTGYIYIYILITHHYTPSFTHFVWLQGFLLIGQPLACWPAGGFRLKRLAWNLDVCVLIATSANPDAPCCWHIYLQNWAFFRANVGK